MTMKTAIEQTFDHWRVMVGTGNLTCTDIGTCHELKQLLAQKHPETAERPDTQADRSDGGGE